MSLLSKHLLCKLKKTLNVKNWIHDSLFIILILPERLSKNKKDNKIWNVVSGLLESDA